MVATLKKPPAKKKAAKPSAASRIPIVEDKPAKQAKPKKPAAAKAPKPETVRVDKLEWDHFKKCRELSKTIETDQANFDEQKKAAMELKSAISGKMVMLRRMVKNGPDRLPLFDGPKPAETNGHATATPATVMAGSEAWRGVALDSALQGPLNKEGSPELKRGVAALWKAKVTTIGGVEDLRAKAIMGDWSSLVKGLGKESMEAVTNAVLAWLDKNRDAKVLAEARNGHAK